MILESRIGKNKEPKKEAALSRSSRVLVPCGAWKGCRDQAWAVVIMIRLRNRHLKAHDLAPFLPGVDSSRKENKNRSLK